jgi:hypothetical protein
VGLRNHHGFHRRRRTILLTLSEPERELLADLLGQLVDMVAPDPTSIPSDPIAAMVGITPDARTPEDPAMARLLPDAYAEPELAGEFRRFTESDLRATKMANARRAISALSRPMPVELDRADILAWLATLNDLRLVLGTRLEVTEEHRPDLSTMSPLAAQTYLVYDWLTYLQDSLLTAVPDPK